MTRGRDILNSVRGRSRIAWLGAGAVLAGALLAGGALPFPTLLAESAEAADVVYAPTSFDETRPKTEIEIMTDAYDHARAVALASDVRVAANQDRIEVLEARLPGQQERSDEALVELYKMQRNKYGVADMLLESESIDDLIKQTEYIESISRANLSAINELKETQSRLEEARANLEEAKAESDAVLRVTADTLNAARAARASKQAAGQSNAGAVADGADWYMTEDEFVAEWAPRIDAYLGGSPLGGQGENFARASWRYCVDPRWSPAISNTESSKGAFCIRPHNAWGWGAADSDPYNLASEWGSWEEAIDAHVRGLSQGYGYTISRAGAEAYCSTPDSWYDNTVREMSMI